MKPGDRLGPYEVIGPLGAGGMGEVYRARDRRLDRAVALKVLPAHVSGDPDRLARFDREAKTLAALNHPNIVTVYSVESDGDRRFLTMELVEGKTLAQLIPAGGMALAPLLAVAIPLADALDCAHRRHVVHRDLKPANVMMTSEGRLKVLDFGLARIDRAPAGAEEDHPTCDLLTRIGQVVGTCAYMSPEQTEGRPVDARSDIFSLGTIFFEMATGRRAFQGGTDMEVLAAVRCEHPLAVGDVRPDLPDTLDQLVRRCLEKHPDRRLQTARDVCNELEDIKKALESGIAGTDASSAALRNPRQRRVAVLPFANMSADQEQEYFCDGMAEDLITALTHVDGLQVAARTSAFAFKGQNRDIREIGRLLDVGSVLEGSVRRAGNRLRITAQLVRVTDGMHLWSERFDRHLDDVFAIQDEISLAIVERLKVQFLAGEETRVVRRHTEDPEAHNDYLKGRCLFARRSEGDITRAMACYEQARARDPEYALPYAGLADALLVLGQWGWLRPREAFPKAKAELERALALDGGLAEAHASLGYLATVYEWDWALAKQSFARATSLSPRYALAHHWYAAFLSVRERFDEAIRESQLSLSLEPLSPIANTQAGQMLFHAGRIPQAIDQLNKALELDAHIPQTYMWLQAAYLAAGRISETLDVGEEVGRLFGPFGPWWTTAALALAGRVEEARASMAAIKKLAESRYVSSLLSFAISHAALGDREAAVAEVERAFEERDPVLPFIRLIHLGRWWDDVLTDARVVAIARRMDLPG